MFSLSPATFNFPDTCSPDNRSPLQLILPSTFRFLCKHVQRCLDLCDNIALSRVSRRVLRSTLAQICAQAALTTADIEKFQSPEMRSDPDLWSNKLSTYLLHPPSAPPPPPLSLCELLRALATHVDGYVHLHVDSPGLLQFSYKLQQYGPTHIQIVNGVLQPRNPLYEARGFCDTYQTWFTPSENPEGKCVSPIESSADTRQQITQRFARCMHPELEAKELLSAGLMASLKELLPPAHYSLVLVQRRPCQVEYMLD